MNAQSSRRANALLPHAESVTSSNLLIVDAGWTVVIASATDVWDVAGINVRIGGQVPPELRALVGEAIESSRVNPSTAFCIRVSPWPGIAITVCAVDSATGQLFAICAQEFQPHTNLRHAQTAFGLSPREVEILRLVLGGHGTTQIAAMLNIADSTVIAHVKSLFSKTKAANRAALVARVLGWEETLNLS